MKNNTNGTNNMSQPEENVFFCLEQATKEAAEEKAKWLTCELVKEKLGGHNNEVTIVNHKKVKESVRLILQTDKNSGEKLTSTIRKKSFIEYLKNHYGVKDYEELHGKKLLASFVIRKDYVNADRIRPLKDNTIVEVERLTEPAGGNNNESQPCNRD